jgi:hypothetical protein
MGGSAGHVGDFGGMMGLELWQKETSKNFEKSVIKDYQGNTSKESAGHVEGFGGIMGPAIVVKKTSKNFKKVL